MDRIHEGLQPPHSPVNERKPENRETVSLKLRFCRYGDGYGYSLNGREAVGPLRSIAEALVSALGEATGL